MGETLTTAPERHEAPSAPEQHRELPEHSGETAQELEQSQDRLETIRQSVEQANSTSEQAQLPGDETSNAPPPRYVNKELKNMALKRSLKQIQRELPAPQRVLSRLVHQPVLKALSEASAKTVTRPSGLLGGGLCAFVGSLVYLYLTKHVGMTYNYFLFSLLFVGGFVVGLILELVWRLVRPRHDN